MTRGDELDRSFEPAVTQELNRLAKTQRNVFVSCSSKILKKAFSSADRGDGVSGAAS